MSLCYQPRSQYGASKNTVPFHIDLPFYPVVRVLFGVDVEALGNEGGTRRRGARGSCAHVSRRELSLLNDGGKLASDMCGWNVCIYSDFWKGTETDLRRLQDLSGRIDLYLNGIGLSCATLRSLASVKGLKALKVFKAPISVSCLVQLRSTLDSLDLSFAAINDDDVIHLAKLRRLVILNLSHTNITDASKRHLQALPIIRQIGLSSTRMSEGVIRELEELARRHDMEARNFE